MAAVTLLGSSFTTVNGTKTVTQTPAVNDLIVIVTAHSSNTASVAPTDNNSGGAGTYTQMESTLRGTSADVFQFWVRDALIASASSTVFTHAPGTTNGGGLAVLKVTGMARVGAAAKKQSAKQENQASGGTPTPVLSAAALTSNPVIGVIYNGVNPAAMTPRSSPAYTELLDDGYTVPDRGIEIMSIDSGETGTSIAWGGTSGTAFGSMVVELDASAPIAGSGIPSAETHGSPGVGVTVVGTGLASVEAHGSPEIGATVVGTSLASAEAHGSPGVGATVVSAGLASIEAFGALITAASIGCTGISSAETFGSPVIGSSGIVCTGIVSEEAFGSFNLGSQISLTGIGSAESVGSPIVGSANVFCTGIVSAEELGSPALTARVSHESILSISAVGLPWVTLLPPGEVIEPTQPTPVGSTPTYPSSLPRPYGFRLVADAQVLADEDSGPQEFRRFTRVPGAVADIRFRFLKDEYATFVEWFRTNLKRGLKWFNLEIPSAGGLAWHVVRFVDKPRGQMGGHRYWEVSTQIEIRERRMDPSPPPYTFLENFENAAVNYSAGGWPSPDFETESGPWGYALHAKAGSRAYELNSLVTMMAQQLSRMSDVPYVLAKPHGLNSRYVRPDTSHSTTRNGLSYATAWGGSDEIDWASLGAGKTLWVCGTWIDASITVTVSGSSAYAFDIRLDHPTDPARLWNSTPVQSSEWTASGVNGEFWLGTLNGEEIDNGEMVLYVDGERARGCSKTSGNTRNIRFDVEPVSASFNSANSSITFFSIERIYQTGDRVIIPAVADVFSVPTPLVRNVQYYAIALADDTIQFAATYADALAGTEIVITDQGAGDIWKLFHETPTLAPYMDPQPGTLAPGEYWWNGVEKRLYWKPVSGDPTDYETSISADRSVVEGAALYISECDYVRIWGGGVYGGIFGTPPQGKVGRCHTNAIQFFHCNYGLVDGVEVSGCRSGIAFRGGTGHISRNCRIRDIGWHGVGGENNPDIETHLLHERHWITDVGRKFDWGDMQAMVFNGGNVNSHIRRNLVQRSGRNAANCNHGVFVCDTSSRAHIYRNISDDCYGSILEVGAGNQWVDPPYINLDSSFSSNITYRSNRDLGEYGSNQAFKTSVYQFRTQKAGTHVGQFSVFGNLAAHCRCPTDSAGETRGLFLLRTTKFTDAIIDDIDFRRNATIQLPLSNAMWSIVSIASQVPTPPHPTFTSDYNIWSGSWPFLRKERTGESTVTYAADHVIGGSAGYWSYDSGQDAHSKVTPATDVDPDDAPELTSAMLEFLRQDDGFDSLTAPSLSKIGLFPFGTSIYRDIQPTSFSNIKFKFRVKTSEVAGEHDDASPLYLYNASNRLFAFWPRRNEDLDALERPYVAIGTGVSVPVHSGVMDDEVWYTGEYKLVSPTEAAFTIREFYSNALIATTPMSVVPTTAITRLRFDQPYSYTKVLPDVWYDDVTLS